MMTDHDFSTPHSGRFEILVKSHREAFQRLARRLSGNPEDAEDLLQETLLDAFRAFGSFRPGSHFYSWVARIMTNNHLDRLRRKQHPVVPLDGTGADGVSEALRLGDESANPERLVLHEQLDGTLQSALDQLQPAQRATVLLCDLEGASYEEAAAVESCPIGTIRSRLHRAHKMMRELMSHLDPQASGARRAAEATAFPTSSRRHFLWGTMAAAGAALGGLDAVEGALAEPEALRVLVWSEGTAPKNVYPHDINTAIAEGLRRDQRLDVRTASLSDPEQGLSDDALKQTDVLIWWGHLRHDQVHPDRVAAVVRRVRDEGMGFIATHSAHYSKPLKALLGTNCGWKGGYFEDGSAVDLRVTAPRHPIARGISGFRIPHTERYEGEFEVPKPDVLIFDGTYEVNGHTAWQGMVWSIGKGRVFYFQPGHESFPIYYQDEVRRVFENAAHWCGRR